MAVQSQVRRTLVFLQEHYIDCDQRFGGGARVKLSPFLARHSSPCSRDVRVEGMDGDRQPCTHKFTLHKDTVLGYTTSTGDIQSCTRNCRSFAVEFVRTL
ncbi:unnamed protein product [Closterium sp. NIES-54]